MSAEPTWLTTLDAQALHEQLVARFGGSAGLRDRGLLESALARPRNHYAYGERDLCTLAATYAAGLVRNHPFVDGNKRVAFLATFTFLAINGLDLRAAEADAVRMMLGLTDRSVQEAAFSAWLAEHCKRRPWPKTSAKRRARRKPPRPRTTRKRGHRG